ncbi:uncharacterized protein LOC143540780 [Bidens hawaiensis]|uniref:uncharacterized protein LOC143540780 n=1 Tax=Bidens hawaiensis TaxID=980011 RepID=UPI00404B9218
MNEFDRAMNLLDEKFSFLASSKQIVSCANEEDKVIVFERGDLVFVFNFHPDNTYDGYKVGCDLPGKYRVVLDSDAWEFGGHGRFGHDVDHFTSPEGLPGVPETNFNNRPNSFKVLSPPRTCVIKHLLTLSKHTTFLNFIFNILELLIMKVYYRVEEDIVDETEDDVEDDGDLNIIKRNLFQAGPSAPHNTLRRRVRIYLDDDHPVNHAEDEEEGEENDAGQGFEADNEVNRRGRRNEVFVQKTEGDENWDEVVEEPVNQRQGDAVNGNRGKNGMGRNRVNQTERAGRV